MSYTASALIRLIQSKGFVSTSGSLTEAELIPWCNDTLRSFIVPFLKTVRDEWFVSGTENVTPDANARIAMPNSVASTIRRIMWMNNNQPTPLVRIEPENAFMYEGQNASNIPYGYMLKGYYIQILPTNIGSVTVRIEFMERPAEMVLEESAGEVDGFFHSGVATLLSTPIAWQESTPASIDIINAESPFSPLVVGGVTMTNVEVVSLAANVLTVTPAITDLTHAAWVTDPGTNPFPNVPIEFHPLLQRSVINDIYAGTGDERLKGSMKLQENLEKDLRRTMAPRTQGSARPIVNRSGPGMRGYSGRWGW